MGGSPSPGCVNGWANPPPGTPDHDEGIAILEGYMGVAGPWNVAEMRYFTGPTRQASSSPASMPPRSYAGLPGQWSGIKFDFVTGEGDGGQPGLPPEVVDCLSGSWSKPDGVPAPATTSEDHLRVELLATLDCPHAERAEEILRQALAEDGREPRIDRVYVSDLDNAAGLGFHGSPTIRIDGRDVVPVPADSPINLGCRLYPQPDGGVSGVIPFETIAAEVERRREAEAQAEPARTHVRDLPSQISRAFFLWASRRRALAAFAMAFPLTRAMVRRFVAGDSLDDALGALERIRAQDMTWTVDVLGESVDSREMALASAARYTETIDALAGRGLDANVSLKLTQMGLDIDRDFCLENVGRVVARARDVGAFVRIDMEDHTKTGVTLRIVRDLNKVHREVGAVIQSYLLRSADDVEQLNNEQIRVRLCNGAYDQPVEVAFKTRDEVDESYARLMERLLLDGRYPGLATHDDSLIDRALRFAEDNGISPDRYEFQMLYGVRRDLQERLVAMGQAVRVYVPYGTQWYPYYMRRLAERPQNVIFMLVSVLREGRGGTGRAR